MARQEAYPNLPEPYRIEALKGKKIKFVASGAAAAHILCIDMEGKLMTWGRNEVRAAAFWCWRDVPGLLVLLHM